MDYAPGKLKEKIVAVLEQHIDHKAIVECDVFLPVVAHPEMEPRQIDVLITTGTNARPTYTIVEVQDRESKPSRGEFGNWLDKMNEVGAQHLICVTKAGYPKSIIQRAEKIGPSVRLFTLKQIEKINVQSLPPSIMDEKIQVITYEKLEKIDVIPEKGFEWPSDINPKNPPDPHYKMFIPYPLKEFVSATDVTDWHLFSMPKNMKDLPKDGSTFGLKFGYDCDGDKPWRIKSKNGASRIKRFDIYIKLRINEFSIEWENSEYEQLGVGEVGWVLKGSAEYNENTKTTVYIPLRKEADGLYYAGQPYTINNTGDTFVQFGEKGFKARNIDSIEIGKKKKN